MAEKLSSDNNSKKLGGHSRVKTPQLNLPKGGAAIREIGEMFAANPLTGTGSMSVLVFTSSGCSSFGLQLALSYESSSGNSSFGFGWALNLPAITLKTDRGLPHYIDNNESDIFILSGAEDLMAALIFSVGNWARDVVPRSV